MVSKRFFLINIVLFFVVVSCDTGLLDVKVPDRVMADVIDDPDFAKTLVAGAQRDFNCFYSNYVRASATFTDELYTSTEFTFPNRLDTRNLTPNMNNNTDCVGNDNVGIYLPMGRSIYTNDQAVEKLESFSDNDVPDRNEMIAQASIYSGFTLVLQGEGYCRGVVEPLGQALLPKDVLAEAEARFDKAVSITSNQELKNLALLGRARARLGMGDLIGAALDAKEIPQGFSKYVNYSGAAADTENQVYVGMNRNQYESIEPQLRDLSLLDGVSDPRVQLVDEGSSGPDGRTPLWTSLKYTDSSSPILLASWEEAQLIIAEAERGQEAVNRINALRDQHNLPHFNSTDEDEILMQIVDERQRELYLTGHRLGDKIRLNLDWKEGVNHKDSFTYAQQYCFPLAQREIDQNPNISN